MNATTAIQKLREIVAPRELTAEQRRACIAARAALGSLAAMVRDYNDAAAPLRGHLAPINPAAVQLRLQDIDDLLRNDRAARAS